MHTGRPPNALPSSTQSCCTAEYLRCTVLSTSCNELRLMAPSIAAVSYFAISYLDQFQLHFLHRFSYFSTKAEPQFLTGVFLTTGLNSMADGISYKNPKYTADRISKHGMAPLRRLCKCMSTKQKLH